MHRWNELPYWVEAPPSGTRALDALGLQAPADEIAEQLLPGLSVLTWRARYFSFLCWARMKAENATNIEKEIHRWEVALAAAEYSLGEDHAKECPFVGSRSIKRFDVGEVPDPPESLYRVPNWRAYRPALVSLGLIQAARNWPLTKHGRQLASTWASVVRGRKFKNRPLPWSACLSEIGPSEAKHLRKTLGIVRGSPFESNEHLDSKRQRRAALYDEVHDEIRRSGDLTPATLLPRYARYLNSKDQTKARLAQAALWEWFTVGLHALFVGYLQALKNGPAQVRVFESALEGYLQRRPPRSRTLEEIRTDQDPEAVCREGIAALMQGLELGKAIPFSKPEQEWVWSVAKSALRGKDSAKKRKDSLLKVMCERHLDTKAEEAWIDRPYPMGRVRPGRKSKIPTVVRPHAYRLWAFGRIVCDLRGW